MYMCIVRSRKILDAEIKLVTDYLSIVHIHSCRLCPVNVVGEVEMLMLKVQSFCSYRVCLFLVRLIPLVVNTGKVRTDTVDLHNSMHFSSDDLL